MYFPFEGGSMDFKSGMVKLSGSFLDNSVSDISYIDNKININDDEHYGEYNLSTDVYGAAVAFLRKSLYMNLGKSAISNNLNELCYKMKEDIVIVECDDVGQDYVSFVNVAAPQNWNPIAVLGKSFTEIHNPVPSENLRRSSKKIISACLNKGPYKRFQWSIQGSKRLNLHSSINSVKNNNNNIEGEMPLYIRLETQHIKGLRKGLGTSSVSVNAFMFSILTSFHSLDSLNISQLNGLRLSLEGLTLEEMKYKGLTDVMELILSQINYYERILY